MKELRIVYDPRRTEDRVIFSNISIHKLSEPLTIQREEPVQEEEQEFGKKKSEIVDYEDDNYQALKDKEQQPYIVTDGESRTYSGKLQDISDSGSVYFAFVNTGAHVRMIPITKWYGFVQKNHFSDGNIETLEKNLGTVEFNEEEGRSFSDEGIDYEAVFDDDNGDEDVVEVLKEKRLTASGKELQGLVETYEKGEEPPINPVNEEVVDNQDEAFESKKVRREASLTKEALRGIFGTGRISVKDLLKAVKGSYKLEEAEKNMIREFIHESCTFEVDSTTGEKIFKLKKIS